MSSCILLDTHVLLWTLLEPDKLSNVIKSQIEAAQKKNQLFISSISLWEIAMLNVKGRINVYEPMQSFLSSINNINGIVLQDISAEIAAHSAMLQNFHGDPADRIIVATALVNNATLLTRDHKIILHIEQTNLIRIISA